ncbi:signal peptidase II [Sulfurimonas diazotrophicus]|uniref:Lipoprotein signal peptidase n=1 Tax=Sulfurimonas diazotrophicus TaxID=3131939 RepID=A0ABZ3HB84_9BACT
MTRGVLALFLALAGIFIIDQNIKALFLGGYRFYSDCIDLTLVYNKGVAFSMFAFLESWLKWLQLLLIAGVVIYVLRLKKTCYMFPVGILVGAGLSNVYDRFVHPGVVDYVYWHCGFDFAVFNFADVMIDVAVLWLLLLNLKAHWCKTGS